MKEYVIINEFTNTYFSYFTKKNKIPMFYPNIAFARFFYDRDYAEKTIKHIIDSGTAFDREFYKLNVTDAKQIT